MTESVRHPARRCTARGTEINSPKEAYIYDVRGGAKKYPKFADKLYRQEGRERGSKNSKFVWTSYMETLKAHNVLEEEEEEESAFEKFELEVAKVSPFVPAITLAAAGPTRPPLPFFMRPTSYYGTEQ